MVTDSIAAQAISATGAAPAATSAAPPDVLQSFNAAFEKAREKQATELDIGSLQSVLSPLLALGEQSARLEAQVAPLSSSEYRPSELMMITMRSHEFLFRCELTANVANRASDGVQQLFRQQS